MKKQTMRWIAMALCVCMWIGHMMPLYAEYELTASFLPGTLTVAESTGDQTVTVKLQLAETISIQAFSYNIICPAEIKIQSAKFMSANIYKSDSLGTQNIYSLGYKGSVSTDYLGEITFLIPGGTAAGDYTISLSLPDNGGVMVNEEKYTLSVSPLTLTVTEKSASVSGSYTAALSSLSTATVGDEIPFSVTVTGDKFSSSYYQLQYDADMLHFVSAEGVYHYDDGSCVTIVDYGNEVETPYTYQIIFEAVNNGETIVSLKNASFSTATGAETDDLIPAVITKEAVTVNIAKRAYAVQLPEIFLGNSQAIDGEPYIFEPVDQVHYTYSQVAATMNGQNCSVTQEEDGSYRIAKVTGPLMISGQRTPKNYTVTFATTTGVELPQNGTATYGKEYTFTLPEKEHYFIYVDSIICLGKEVSYAINGKQVTLAGSSVQGDIIITLEKQRSDADVSVEGIGASDLTYLATAEPGKPFSAELTVDGRYNYEVSATVNGVAVTLQQNGNVYTIPAEKVKAGTIVFTVVKTLKTNAFDVKEYLNFDGTTVWLVENKVERQANSLYTYCGTEMFWSETYQAYCTLVVADSKSAVTASDLGLSKGNPVSVDYNMDVNQSGKLDVNDAQLVYNLYNAMYDDFTDNVTIEKVLRADVNGDKTVDVKDARAIVDDILGK